MYIQYLSEFVPNIAFVSGSKSMYIHVNSSIVMDVQVSNKLILVSLSCPTQKILNIVLYR